MEERLSPHYSIIGKFCVSCGAVEFELDRFLFGASDQYRGKLAARYPRWPQQATDKQNALAFAVEQLMQQSPSPLDCGFSNFSEVKETLRRLYEVRNLLLHGTPTTSGTNSLSIELCKVQVLGKGKKSYKLCSHQISYSEISQLTTAAENLVLFLEACVVALRRERGGWLSIDLTIGGQFLKEEFAKKREIVALKATGAGEVDPR